MCLLNCQGFRAWMSIMNALLFYLVAPARHEFSNHKYQPNDDSNHKYEATHAVYCTTHNGLLFIIMTNIDWKSLNRLEA